MTSHEFAAIVHRAAREFRIAHHNLSRLWLTDEEGPIMEGWPGVGWVITGGESGWKARPAELDWFRGIRDASSMASIPFFHKQHGGRGTDHKAKRSGDLAVLDGELYQEYPVISGQEELF